MNEVKTRFQSMLGFLHNMVLEGGRLNQKWDGDKTLEYGIEKRTKSHF